MSVGCMAHFLSCEDLGTHDVVLIDAAGERLPEQEPHRYCVAHANLLARSLVQTYFNGEPCYRIEELHDG